MKKLAISIAIGFTLIMSILIYGRFVATNGLVTKETALTSSNLPSGYNGLKIVHFSDLLLNTITTPKTLKKIVQEINLINPDIVVFTGDLIHRNYQISNSEKETIIKYLTDINSKYGKYAVIGDQDYDRSSSIKDIYLKSNFTLLENTSDIIYNENNEQIFIGGLANISQKEANIEQVMSEANQANYQILLMHESDYIDTVLNQYKQLDLILAGHSLNGQVNLPYLKKLLLPTNGKKYFDEHYQIGTTQIFVSSGIGVSISNFRLFNRPSINFYRITQKQ